MSTQHDYAHRHAHRLVVDEMHHDTYDARRDLKLQRAIEWMGPWWRGQSRCSHRYTTSAGEKVVLKEHKR